MISDSDKALIVDLKLAEDARLLFRELGFALELWEALRLARTEHVTLTCEMERLQKLRKLGRSPSLGGLIIDSIEQTRKALTPRVRNYRDVLRSSNIAGDSVRLDLLAGLLAQHPTLPTADEIMALAAQVDRCRTSLLHRPATEVRRVPAAAALPPDVNVDLAEDLRYAQKLRLSFGPASPGIELWEAMTLALEDRASAQMAAEKLKARREDDGSLIRILERILDVRTKHSRLAIKLRNYMNHLPIGKYNRDLMELAFGFLLASSEGRGRAEQWLEDPKHFLREAAIRVEGVIGKAQRYQALLQVA
jgi:hypothetical protein